MHNPQTPDVRPGAASTPVENSTWTPLPHEPSVPPPDFTCEPWLSIRCAQLALAGDLFGVGAAVGTIARLSSPQPGDTPCPTTLTARWALALPPREIVAMERLAVERAGALIELLRGDEDEDEDLWINMVVRERDALEGVLVVLRLAGRGTDLSAQLRLADDEATTSGLRGLVQYHALTRAVGVAEPDAWWGFDYEADMRDQRRAQDDVSAHMAALNAANRVLRGIYHARAPDSARPWQYQLGLVTHSGHEPGVNHGARWGVIATVFVWDPKCGEFQQSWWGPTWREAIADAVYGMATL